MDRHRRHLALRRLRLQPRGRADRPGRGPARAGGQGLGPARVPQPRRHGRARHPQHQGGAPPPAPLGARGRGGRARPFGATIRRTAEQGWLDVVTRPERHNAVKVLLFLDVGGSMDPHVRVVEELFSAARAEFKHLEHFYFHNCLYEGVWRDNRRRWDAADPDRRGPAHLRAGLPRRSSSATRRCRPTRSPQPGGANEHWNAESGETWLRRLLDAWPQRDLDQPAAASRLGLFAVGGDDRRASSAGGCSR